MLDDDEKKSRPDLKSKSNNIVYRARTWYMNTQT